jgi:hypothetical protein
MLRSGNNRKNETDIPKRVLENTVLTEIFGFERELLNFQRKLHIEVLHVLIWKQLEVLPIGC